MNTESFFWEDSEFDDVSPILILAKTEGLGCSSFLTYESQSVAGFYPFESF